MSSRGRSFRGLGRGGRGAYNAFANEPRHVPAQNVPVEVDWGDWGGSPITSQSSNDSCWNGSQTNESCNWKQDLAQANIESDPNTIMVENRFVGKIIGKRGATIKDLQSTTGAKIDVLKDNGDGFSTPVKISGDESSCEQARERILELISSPSRPATRDNEIIIEVESSFVGKVIGSGGSKIKELQSESKARIMILEKEVHRTKTPISISGSEEARETAKKLIEEITDPYHGCTVSSGDAIQPETNNGDRSYDLFNDTKIDWSKMNERCDALHNEQWKDFPNVKKNFYFEHPDVANMHPEDVITFRQENNNISVQPGKDYEGPLPNPVATFEQAFSHYPEILDTIAAQGFERPSPIQCQAWPVLLQGNDLIGIAQTGTGKTLAFLLPAMIHLDGQLMARSERQGPSVIVMSPTRELAIQIQTEVEKYSYKDIKCLCVYGGGDRREQIRKLKQGVEIVVATPGRLIDLVEANELSLQFVTYAVLDEADRMLDLGFEPQIMRILRRIRPDRQTAMTSATWPWEVKDLADRYMKKPIHVNVGSFDLTAVHTVTQLVEFLEEDEKRDRLDHFLKEELQPNEKVLVFMKRKSTVDDVVCDYALKGVHVQSMHGGRDQMDREQALKELRDGDVNVLIATDLAARGIDIPDVTHVLNYDFPLDIEEYVHRIGRTGRAGRSGVSISLITHRDWRHSPELIKIMEEANQEVPDELRDMAERFRRRKEWEERTGNTGRRGGRGGRGGGRRWGRRD